MSHCMAELELTITDHSFTYGIRGKDTRKETQRILHECSCIIGGWGQEIKCSQRV